jgi:DNA-directed RNA polymerase specialized sigma24 family protein/tetratricopeptide (TPR) repeat protein
VAIVPDEELSPEVGDRGGFEAFYRAEFAPVVRLAFVLTGRQDLAEELAQDGFLAAHRRWDRVSVLEHPGGWVRRVVTNRCISSGRRHLTELRLLTPLRRERVAPVELAPADDELWSAVRDLPARQAQVLALVFLEDRAVADVADILGCGPYVVDLGEPLGNRDLVDGSCRAGIGIITMWPDPIGSRPGLERARGLAVATRDDLALMHTTQALGMTYVFQDEDRRARPFLDEAHRLAERMGQQDALAWHWVATANGAWVRGDLPALRSAADRGLAVAVATGDVVTESVATSLLAVGATETGQPERGLARLAAVRERAVAGGGLLMLPVTEWVAAQALAADGQLEEARTALAALIDDGAGGLAYILARAHMTLAETLRLLGNANGAVRAAERCLDVAGEIAARTIAAEAQLTLGRVATARGDWLEARRLHHDALPVSVDYGSPRLQRVLDGLAALACGLERHTEAARIIGAAARRWDETGTTPWPHQRSEERAVEERVRHALGDQDFAGALAAGRALDAEGVVAYVRRTRGSRGRPSTGWDSLTPTERQVVALVGTGASNQEIAAELLMSVATVKSHLTHVYSKLGLRGRAALAGDVVRRGEAAQR